MLLLVCFSSSILLSQTVVETSAKKNSIYLDLGGYAVWYSLNYEHKISLATNHRFALGGGISIIPPDEDANFLIGASVNYLYGKVHNLEVGISPSYDLTGKEFLFAPRIGYRYEAPKGFLFRIGLSPVYGNFFTNDASDNQKEFVPWGYISFGYSF